MSVTALQAARDRAKHHGIKIAMHEDFARYQIVVRGQLGDIAYDHRINRQDILSLRIEDMDAVYADAHHKVIDALVGYPAGGTKDTLTTISELQRELDRYKATVKQLAFQLEMAERSGTGVMLREDEVRRLALEQAAEHLMDHGIVTTGSELVAVCEQIKKLQRSEVRV